MIAVSVFGVVAGPGGAPTVDVHEVVLESPQLRVSVLTLGAGLNRVQARRPDGGRDDLALHLRWLAPEGGRGANPYLGATVGRYANRIAGARFVLDGTSVDLVPNEGDTTLHGGPDGFHARVWDLVAMGPVAPIASALGDDDGPPGSSVTLSLCSDAGDQGFPGRLVAHATYAVRGPVLTIAYTAVTSAPTVVNLANHAYWNLDGAGTVADHQLQVVADRHLPVDRRSLPVGGLEPVEGTPFDLRRRRRVGDVLAELGGDLDHCYAVGDRPAGDRLSEVARLRGPISGRTLSVRTDQPALQVYAGTHLADPFVVHGGICLETQRFPDAPNRPELGPCTLRPGETYTSTTELHIGGDGA